MSGCRGLNTASFRILASILFTITSFFSSFHSDLSFNNLQSLPDNVFAKLNQLNIL